MTETILKVLRAVPRQLLPLVPFAVLSVVAVALAGLALLMVHVDSGEGPWLSDRSAVVVSSPGPASVGTGQTRAGQSERGNIN
jgi:hypothetical protein